MGANMPKQYLLLRGEPIATHSLRLFASMPEVGEVVVVCDPSYRDVFTSAALPRQLPLHFALPGKERQDSVESGLRAISPDAALVAIHDSARPLVTRAGACAVCAPRTRARVCVTAEPPAAAARARRGGRRVCGRCAAWGSCVGRADQGHHQAGSRRPLC